MLVVFSIIGVIVAVSLYDYFTSRSWQMVTSTERNNSVFENRNKEYGAYKIRKDYDKRLILILLSLTVGVGGLFAANSMFKNLEKETKVTVIDTVPVKFDEIPDDEVTPVIEEKTEETVIEKTEEQLKFTEMIASDTKLPEEKTVIVDPDIKVGSYEKKEDGDIFGTPPLEKKKEGLIETKGFDKEGVAPYVDEPARFPGGVAALHDYIRDHINVSAVEGGGRVNLKFVVDEQGKVSKVTFNGKKPDCDGCIEAAIKVMQKSPDWIPGKLNGEVVKSYYTMPIVIATE